ncbi:hypothetical protein V3851_04265 [Paenibacillus sp. M1]|uniref:Phage protein n=1 Tax=Paenibacillus haidiansis TaxID=1574488 RepID=A0ABU7VMN9_9BACL
MTQTEFFNALKAIGYPVVYSHFSTDPAPPYLVYVFAYSDDMMADNLNYLGINNFQVELYTTKKDLAAEKLVKDKLKELELPYTQTEAWIEDDKLFQNIFEIQLIGE